MAEIAASIDRNRHGPGQTPATKASWELPVSGAPESTPDLSDALSMRLEGGVEAASLARRALARLRGDIDPPVMETMRLLVTELVGNSVRHAGAKTVGLKVLVTDSSLWTEVTDEGPGFEPEQPRREGGQDTGWGLFLVERLADRWGVLRDGPQTRVWFELKRAA
jgi:anti-sigma regulatory factor (Ser/Thr protein kinase)